MWNIYIWKLIVMKFFAEQGYGNMKLAKGIENGNDKITNARIISGFCVFLFAWIQLMESLSLRRKKNSF